MLIFQVSSRSVQSAVPPKKKPRRLRQEWSDLIRFVLVVNGAGWFVSLLTIFRGSNDRIFILFPVFLSLAIGQVQRYNRSHRLHSTPISLLLTICLTFIYYGTITEALLLIFQSPTPPVAAACAGAAHRTTCRRVTVRNT